MTGRRQTAMTNAWAFTVLVALLGVAIWSGLLAFPDSMERPFSIPWWMLTPLVFIGESAVIHLTFRKDSHSFSLSEIILVLGLFLSSPATLLLSELLGNTASLVLQRRQVPIKAAFNTAQLMLVAGLAVLIFRSVVDPADPLGPLGWLGAFAATTSCIAVAELAINAIVRITGGRMSRKEIFETLTFGAAGAAINTVLGLIVVIMVWHDPRVVWLAAVPPVLMYAAYRTYATQRKHHRHVESMHAVTEAIHTAPDLTEALLDAAHSARELVNAEWIEIIVFRDEGPRPYRTNATLQGDGSKMAPSLLVEKLPPWWPQVIGNGESAILHGPSWSAIAGSPKINKDAIVAPIIGSERLHGYVLAADRLGDVSVFNSSDIQLLETVAKQVSTALDNGRLEATLANVTALKEQLEEVVKSKDQFVASVSHELRTPLTAVLGFAEELENNLEAYTPADLGQFIGLIARESNILSHIIEDLLVAARADIGTLAMHPQEVDVEHLIREVLDADRDRASGQIELRGGAMAFADPLRLRQIVRNLVTNARRYGGDAILIEVEQLADLTTIAVIDDGPGVPEERKDAIFDAYERGHTDTIQPGSVGLGLAVSRQLARMMGGDILYRRHNDTTRFEVTVPARAQDRQAAAVSWR